MSLSASHRRTEAGAGRGHEAAFQLHGCTRRRSGAHLVPSMRPEPSSAPAMLSPENLLEAFASNLASLPRLPPPIQVFPSSCAILLYLNSSSNLSHCMPRSSFPGAICLPDLVSLPFPRGGGRLWGPLMAGPTHSDESSSSVELMHQFDAILRKPFPPGERASRISRGLWACTQK